MRGTGPKPDKVLEKVHYRNLLCVCSQDAEREGAQGVWAEVHVSVPLRIAIPLF